MESLNNNSPVLQQDVINVENVECRTPTSITSCAGSDRSISTAKAETATEAAIVKRNDVMLRLMGHLIPVSTGPEEGSASETDTSIVSSASTLKRRLHNLPPPSEAVKLADRVAALNRRIRRERDLYIHLQGLTNRIEEKDEGDLSTTDSSKTINSTSNQRHQSQINNARVRRRERFNSGSAMSQYETSSDLPLYSPGSSSPEPLTLKEIREDLAEEMDQISSPIKDQYSLENPMINVMQEDTVTGLSHASINYEYEMTDEMISSCQNASQFSNALYTDENIFPDVNDFHNSTDVIDVPSEAHPGLSTSDFSHPDYFNDGLIYCNLSPEVKNPHVTATTPSTTLSTGVDYPYVSRKKTPTKFGGYRPSSGLILRNLSSDSESDTPSDRIAHKGLYSQKYGWGNRNLENHHAEEQELHDSGFDSTNFCSNPARITGEKSFCVERMEILKDRLLSPVLSADSRLFFEESNSSQRIETPSELQIPEKIGWAPVPTNGKSHDLDEDSGNLKRNSLVDENAGNFCGAKFVEKSFTNSFCEERDSQIPRNLTYDTSSVDALEPVYHVSLSEEKQSPYLSSSRDTETVFSREEANYPNHGTAVVNLSKIKSSAEVSEITNHQSLPASVRSLSECIVKPDDLRNGNRHPKIPPLEIESHNCSQSHSLSSENRENETTRSSLDVNALIQALSDVSLRQKNSTNCTNQSMIKLKSPLAYGNRFSGSSGPRSSEYTPALGGSRQSLTSLEVSEAHSIEISKGELTARRQATTLVKSDERSARSAAKIDKLLENLSIPSPNINKSSMPLREPPSKFHLFRENSFIPLVAKVDKTNLVCSEHPLKIKSIGKLISPRKYQSTDFREEIANPMTSRTDVSQLSKVSRKSFRSLKSVQPNTKVHRKKIDDSQPKINTTGLPAPSSGRRVLEPLNLVPKIQPDLLTSINRRKKTANDLSEIINSHSGAGSDGTMTTISSRNSSRRSPLSRTNKSDLPIPRMSQRRKNRIIQPKRSGIDDPRVLISKEIPEESFDNTSKPLTEPDHKLAENSNKCQQYLSVSSEKSSVISGNVLYLRSEKLSLSSGDYEGNISWSPSPRDEDFTENDNTYDSEDKSYDLKGPVSVDRENFSEAMDLGAQNMTLSKFTNNSIAKPVRNCVHLNDLQDGREVTLPCFNAKCQENGSRKKELFNRLPNEISGSLTRHTSFGSHVAENLQSTKEIPSTIEDLRRNIQENNDRWMKNFKNDDESENILMGSANDKVFYTDSSVQYKKSQYQNLLSNPKKISHKIPPVVRDSSWSQLPLLKTVEGTESPLCSRSSVSGRIDLGRSDNESLSPLHENIKQESEYNSESGQLNSQRSTLIHTGDSSHQNTYRSVAESTDSTSVLKFDEALDHAVNKRDFAVRMTEPGENESCNFKEEGVDSQRHNVRIYDGQVISIRSEEAIARKDRPERPNLNTDAKCKSDDDVEALKTMPSNIENLENLECNSTLNRPSEYSESKLKKLGYCDEDCEQSEEKIKAFGCDRKSQIANELEECEPSRYLRRCSEDGSGIFAKISSPSNSKLTKPHTVAQLHQDVITSSPISIKSFASMSKLNSSVDSKWDVTVVTGANNVKKSQDRFPFTISESASKKTSKFKVLADVSLDQLIQDQNSHTKRKDQVLTQHPILPKSGDQEKVSTDTFDVKKKSDCCEQSPVRQLTPFLEEFTIKIPNDSPDNWEAQLPSMGLNYISYGCREEPRTLMPNVKEMVKKISAKLRYGRMKRHPDAEDTRVKILYRNKKCRCDFGEGSSSAASLYQSQLLNTSNELVPNLIRGSNNSSGVSSGKVMNPKSHHQCISMSMQPSPRKWCDQNDLWIQEFDSDVEFDTLQRPSLAYCKMSNDSKKEAMPRTSSPVNDRYSMFLARRKLSGIINNVDHNELSRMSSALNYCEGGDSEKVNCKKPKDVDLLSSERPEMVLKSIKTSVISINDNANDFEMYTTDGNCEDSTPKSGCCCFKIYQFFIGYKGRSLKTHKRMKG